MPKDYASILQQVCKRHLHLHHCELDARTVLKQWGCYQRHICLPSTGYASMAAIGRVMKATSPDYSGLPDDLLQEWDVDEYPEDFMELVEIWLCENDQSKLRILQLYFVNCLSYRAAAETYNKRYDDYVAKDRVSEWVNQALDGIQSKLDNRELPIAANS